ncbi:hypothetical protein HK102_012964 [Quaeritorhiza haematococci]|nr:hypothetical protein HK102_012964 [Quaeritorhiza haematococci]
MRRQVETLEKELEEHSSYRDPMEKMYINLPSVKTKALNNWIRKQKYLMREYEKYTTYVQVLRHVIGLKYKANNSATNSASAATVLAGNATLSKSMSFSPLSPSSPSHHQNPYHHHHQPSFSASSTSSLSLSLSPSSPSSFLKSPANSGEYPPFRGRSVYSTQSLESTFTVSTLGGEGDDVNVANVSTGGAVPARTSISPSPSPSPAPSTPVEDTSSYHTARAGLNDSAPSTPPSSTSSATASPPHMATSTTTVAVPSIRPRTASRNIEELNNISRLVDMSTKRAVPAYTGTPTTNAVGSHENGVPSISVAPSSAGKTKGTSRHSPSLSVGNIPYTAPKGSANTTSSSICASPSSAAAVVNEDGTGKPYRERYKSTPPPVSTRPLSSSGAGALSNERTSPLSALSTTSSLINAYEQIHHHQEEEEEVPGQEGGSDRPSSAHAASLPSPISAGSAISSPASFATAREMHPVKEKPNVVGSDAGAETSGDAAAPSSACPTSAVGTSSTVPGSWSSTSDQSVLADSSVTADQLAASWAASFFADYGVERTEASTSSS